MIRRLIRSGLAKLFRFAIGTADEFREELTDLVPAKASDLSERERWCLLIQLLTVKKRQDKSALWFPLPYRTVWLCFAYTGEVYNGGVLQYFTNGSGRHAPYVADALRLVGLPDQAMIVDDAIALFEHPFPRGDSDRNEQAMKGTVGATLDALTRKVDTEAIDDAMIAYTKRMNLLPV